MFFSMVGPSETREEDGESLTSGTVVDAETVRYAREYGFPHLLGDQYSEVVDTGIRERISRTPGRAIAPDLVDLVRLHRLVRQRKVSTILEFGVGFSTLVMADALSRNESEYADVFRERGLRRENPFEVHSVDSEAHWIAETTRRFPERLGGQVRFHHSPVAVTEFNGRICHAYESLPNICPDFVYLDGPSPFSVQGDVRGISFGQADRTVLACDLLKIEWLLLPGSLIVIDGRTNNARFLRANFQRDFVYEHLREEDVHLFELVETTLGPHNSRQIEFSLGADRLKSEFL